MPFDGSGNFSCDHQWVADASAGIKIRADIHDTHDNDIAYGLSQTILKDGRSTITANIPFGNHKITGLANGVNPTDAVNFGQLSGIKTFTTGIVLSGSTVNGMVTFGGSTGPTGLSWSAVAPNAAQDVFFGVTGTAGAANWVWNDKANGTGINCMALTENGFGASALTVRSQLDTVGSGPVLYLDRTRGTTNPAANDTLGVISFRGNDNTQALTTYGQIYAQILDPTNTSEDSRMIFQTCVAGALSSRIILDVSGADVTGDLTASGQVISAQNFRGLTTSTVFGNTTTGTLYFRPVGYSSATSEMRLANTGDLTVNGTVIAADDIFRSDGAAVYLATNSAGTVYLRPVGSASATGQTSIDSAGNMVVAGNITAAASTISTAQVVTTGNVTATGSLIANSASPMVMGLGGEGRIMQMSPSWYWGWHSTTGDLTWHAFGGQSHALYANGNFTISGATATKSVAGSWVAPSDIRLKDVRGDYQHGLAEVLQVQPVRYSYKRDPETEYVGLIAQDIEGVFPEMVTLVEGEIDGTPVSDLRQFDPTALSYALINAVKELAHRVTALEGTPA